MGLLVAAQLNFMRVPGSTGSVRLILTYKVKHGLYVFEELLPKTYANVKTADSVLQGHLLELEKHVAWSEL